MRVQEGAIACSPTQPFTKKSPRLHLKERKGKLRSSQAGFEEARSMKGSWGRFPCRSTAGEFRPGLHGCPHPALPSLFPGPVAAASPLSVPPAKGRVSLRCRLGLCLRLPLPPASRSPLGLSRSLHRSLYWMIRSPGPSTDLCPGLWVSSRRSPRRSSSLFRRFSVLPRLESQARYSSLAVALSPPGSPTPD